MRVGSLFSGIGGLELGLQAAGVGHTVWQVEKDAFCRAVLEKHWPDAYRYEDVCEVGSRNLERVDVICGGFPCQDLSLAGKGAGLSGERSGLWYEYARIIGELRPRFVVIENVAALLRRGFDEVLSQLDALGYDAEWSCIRVSDVGGSHRRDRLFVIAWERGVANPALGHGARQDRRHCRATTGRLAGFCEPDECSCPCNGCCPPGALSEAKRALADAVMEYVIKHA